MEGTSTPASTPAPSAEISGDSGSQTSDASPDTGAQSNAPESENVINQTSQKVAQKKEQEIRELEAKDLDALVRIKVNGQERKMSVREAIKLKQLEQASTEKLTQGKQMQAQARALAEFAKNNPKDFLKQVCLDPYEFAEATLAEKLEMLGETPEQKELRELRAERAERAEKEKKQRADLEAQEMSERESKAMEILDREIADAWKESQLPKHKFYFQQIAAEMLSSESRGENLSAKEAAARVKTRFETHVRDTFDQLDAEAIRRILPKSVLKKLNEAEIKKVTDKIAPTPSSASKAGIPPAAEKKTNPRKPMSEKEWRQWVEKHKSE